MTENRLMKLVSYEMREIYIDYDHTNYYRNSSSSFDRKKISRFRDNHNLECIQKCVNKSNKKTARINVKKRELLIDKYDFNSDNSSYITTIDSIHYPNIFNNIIHITSGIYINNNRKYRNFELLFKYDKFDCYEYVSNCLNQIFKTNS